MVRKNAFKSSSKPIKYADEMTEKVLSRINEDVEDIFSGKMKPDEEYKKEIDMIVRYLKENNQKPEDKDKLGAIEAFEQHTQRSNYDPHTVHWYGMMLATDLNAPASLGNFLRTHGLGHERYNHSWGFFDAGASIFDKKMSPAKEEKILKLMEHNNCRFYQIGTDDVQALIVKHTPKLTDYELLWATGAYGAAITAILDKKPTKEQLAPIVYAKSDRLDDFSIFVTTAYSEKETATAENIIELIGQFAAVPKDKRVVNGKEYAFIDGNRAIAGLAEMTKEPTSLQIQAKVYNTMADIVEKQPDCMFSVLEMLKEKADYAKATGRPLANGDKNVLTAMQRLQNTALKAFERSVGAEISKAMAYNNGNMGNNPHTK